MAYLSAIEIEPGEGMVRLVKSVLTEAMAAAIDRTQGFYTIDGMSGYRYRWFINTLVRRMAHPAYLEVGSWQGSTLCAAIAGNAVRALAIDNWSEFGGPKDQFLANVGRFRGDPSVVAGINTLSRRPTFSFCLAIQTLGRRKQTRITLRVATIVKKLS